MGNQTDNSPEGFKMTELGLLPDTWESLRLDVVARVKYGKANPGESGSIPVVGSGGVFSYTKTALVDHPTIVVGRKGTAGRVWFSGSPCYPSDTTFYLQWKRDIDVTFLFHFMGANPLSGGHAKTTLPSLQKHYLESMIIAFPPLPEQKAIARVLSTIQAAIEAQDKVIAAARDLKKSLMKHLFTYGPVPLAEAEKVQLKETEIGPLPKHWDVVRLGERCAVRGGKRLPKGHAFAGTPTRHPYIRVVDFVNGSVDMSNLKFLIDSDFRVISRYTISCEDVYVSIAGTIGLVGTIPDGLNGANLTENAAKLVIIGKDGLKRDYLKYCLLYENQQKQISQLATKTSQPKLALSRIEQIGVPLPSIAEQEQIAAMLSCPDSKIEAETKRKRSLEALFKTMLHNLMTGKIRVKDLEGIIA
jgi:type I restriction enzyme, S subunit